MAQFVSGSAFMAHNSNTFVSKIATEFLQRSIERRDRREMNYSVVKHLSFCFKMRNVLRSLQPFELIECGQVFSEYL